MELVKSPSKINWQFLSGTKQANRVLFEPWNRYKQLKKEAPYKTEHRLKNGFCWINDEMVEHVEHGNIPMVVCLFELGADANAPSSTFARIRRPITAAAQVGSKEMCELLIESGADVNAKDYEKVELIYDDSGKFEERKVVHYNALWQAVYHGHVAIVELLFAHGIQNPENNAIELPWRHEISLHKNYHAMRELLKERGIEISIRSPRDQEWLDTELIDCVNRHEYEWAKLAIERGANVNFYTRSYSHGSALIHAARKGWSGEKFVALLLKNGADPNIVDDGLNTPLIHGIAKRPCQEVCRLLLAYGADQFLQNCNGNTALMIAASCNKHESEKICPILIDHQKEQEKRAVTLILCLKYHESLSAQKLYRWRKELMRPHLERYTLKGLMNLKDNKGRTVFDFLG